MGWHNRLTLEQYNYIKDKVKTKIPYGEVYKTLREIAKEVGYGYTTVHHIYLSKDYEAYCKRTKGKYWYASEEDKTPVNLPHLQLKNRQNVQDSAQTLVIEGKEYKIKLSLEPVGGN